MNIATQAAQIGLDRASRTGAVTVPIFQTATFRHPALGESTGYDYSRSGNPTREALEQGLALLDGGCRGFAFSSGMAAITTLLLLFRQGDHIIVTEDLYGGSYRLFEQIFQRFGLQFSYVDTSDVEEVAKALRPNTAGLFVESLTNPLLKVADVEALARLCKEKGVLCIVDNTFLTPYLLRPLDLGADIALYSGSKYLAGHNDTICGLVTAKDPELAERIYFHQNGAGAVLGPQDSFLTIRGMKTLSVRLDRQQENADAIARHLAAHPKVQRVYYPGLHGHPGHALMSARGKGYGAMIAFEVTEPHLVNQLLTKTQLISFAESLGGVESLITFPQVQTHADIEPEKQARLGINNLLLRLSVGIEDKNDLIADLDQALA